MIVRNEGFALNQSKTRVMRGASQQVVTGVVVNEHLNIDRKAYDRLKAIIHACGKPDDQRLLDPTFRSSLVGKIDWVEAVNPSGVKSYVRCWLMPAKNICDGSFKRRFTEASFANYYGEYPSHLMCLGYWHGFCIVRLECLVSPMAFWQM